MFPGFTSTTLSQRSELTAWGMVVGQALGAVQTPAMGQ